MPRQVSGGRDGTSLFLGEPVAPDVQANCPGLDESHSHGQHGAGDAGSRVCIREVVGLQCGADQSWPSDPATAERHQCFVGVHGGWRT